MRVNKTKDKLFDEYIWEEGEWSIIEAQLKNLTAKQIYRISRILGMKVYSSTITKEEIIDFLYEYPKEDLYKAIEDITS